MFTKTENQRRWKMKVSFDKHNYFYQLDHGLRTPRESFFFENPKLLGLGRQIGPKFFGAFGVFSADLSAPILVLWVPCPCFPLIKHYFYKKNYAFISKTQQIIWEWELNSGCVRSPWTRSMVCSWKTKVRSTIWYILLFTLVLYCIASQLPWCT